MDLITSQFIINHANDDIHQLSLQSSKYPNVDIALAIKQINGRQKIKHKIPTFYSKEEILYPVQLSLEQSSSESTAKYKAMLCEGNTLTDITGGFGIDCYFISEHFDSAIYVERQEELCKLATHNFEVLNRQNIKVINADSENYLSDMNPVDWIFVDPARRSKSGSKVVLLSDCEPDVNKLSTLLLEKATKVMIKLSPMMDIAAAQAELPATSEIHVISVDNECKEVLIILDNKPATEIRIKTINFTKTNSQLFDFKQNEESNQQIKYAKNIGDFLYEPNAAIMKSGAFKLIATRFNIEKLHQNTHLYTSNELIADFPGRIFRIQKVWENSKKELKQNCERIKTANITTRNYPLSVSDLRKKLKLNEGGNSYLFACTASKDSKIIIECTKA